MKKEELIKQLKEDLKNNDEGRFSGKISQETIQWFIDRELELELENDNLQQEIARLNKIIERLVNYNELVYKRYDRKIKDYPIRSIVNHNLEIIKELKEEGKE